MYDAKGKLTRDGAVAVIRSGGTVLLGGRIYGTLESLPGEADFAKGDERAEAQARERLQKQIVDAQKQLAEITPGRTVQVADVPPPTDDLDDRSVEDLKAMAKDKGIPHSQVMGKAKLIESLRAQP